VKALSNKYIDALTTKSYELDGAVEICEKLYNSGNFRMYLVTNGQKQVQEGRLFPSPVFKFFDDCFISERCETRGIQVAKDKIQLIKDGGCAWFTEYATLDGTIVKANWCNTMYGYSLRVEMPNGEVVWTTAKTAKGLAKKGIKRVECKRPAWYAYKTPYSGMMGVYTGSYELFPSNVNYATGEDAKVEPLEVRDV
jgi:hypothetical protein